MNGQTIRVLLVEDNPGDARLLQEMLCENPTHTFHITWADSLQQATHHLSTTPFDVAILDLSLPDANDLDTVNQTTQLTPDLPIVVLTGSAGDEKGLRALRHGAQDYLTKGRVEPDLLIRAIRYAIERKHTQSQLAHYTRELQARNQQIQNDILLAREIQLALLPQHLPTFPPHSTPEKSALRFQHHYQPATYLAGDFFDIFPINDTTAGIFICDVMGHGIRAALITAIIRPLVDELAATSIDPSQLLTAINQKLVTILQQTKNTIYATAFYLIADTANHLIHYATAGHPAPLRLNRPTGTTAPLPLNHSSGPALGLFNNQTYTTFQQPLAPGDLILLYTDGLTEATNPAGDEYGETRLLSTLQTTPPGQNAIHHILSDVKKFADEQEFADDLCLITVEATR